MNIVGPRSTQPLRTAATAPTAARPGLSAQAMVSDLRNLLGSGQLAVPVQKVLTNELKRLENLLSHAR